MNDAAGARTTLAGAATAGVALLTVLFLTGIFEELPEASLAAVVIVAAAGLVDLEAIRMLGRIRGSAITVASVTVLGVLLFGVLGGVLIGVILSMLGLIAILDRLDILVVARPGDELVARIEGPVFYANVSYVHAELLALADAAPVRPRTLVLDLVAVPDTDVTSLLRVSALERDLSDRSIALRFENVPARLLALGRRTPGLSDRC